MPTEPVSTHASVLITSVVMAANSESQAKRGSERESSNEALLSAQRRKDGTGRSRPRP
jgi:hypothetical protein